MRSSMLSPAVCLEQGGLRGHEACRACSCSLTGYPLVMTNIAIENLPFIVHLPIKNGDFP